CHDSKEGPRFRYFRSQGTGSIAQRSSPTERATSTETIRLFFNLRYGLHLPPFLMILILSGNIVWSARKNPSRYSLCLATKINRLKIGSDSITNQLIRSPQTSKPSPVCRW